ncbi:MAG TPA: DUF349 domain-containing protein [Bacteroidales bacterium]|nr:DUF349 domain-containing protein [Bacteroidales bacterium]
MKEQLNPKVESNEQGDENLNLELQEQNQEQNNQDLNQEVALTGVIEQDVASGIQVDDSLKGISFPEDQEEEEEEEAVRAEISEGDEDPAEKYGKMSRSELVLVLEALVKHEDINFIRNHIGFIRAAFRKHLKEESLENYEKTIAHQDSLIEIQEITVAQVDPLVKRFDDALLIYKDKKALFDQAIEKQKVENLKAKEQLLEELRHLIESEEELKKTYDKFRDLQEKWRNYGPVPQTSKNTLWNNYHFLVEKFFDKIKINKELKDLDLKKNLEQKTLLCEKAEELLLEPSIITSFQRLQKLHEAWKESGPVPGDKKDEIWDRFKAATEKLNRRRQEYYDTLHEEQQENLEAKQQLCEKAELLSASTPDTPRQWQNLTNQINELFQTWKTVGFAPKKINNEVWNRFRAALDVFFRNKKEFFSKFKENQTENYNQKLNLCLQAEALKDSTDWRRTTNELIALQQEWKKIGPVPNKFSDKIWKRFRAACDEFFIRKAQHISSIEGAHEENLNLKKELIANIKTFNYSSNNIENLRIINEFQRQWMEIGHVPIKLKDKLQAEYRNAIDEQFEKLGISQKAKSTLTFRTKIENLKNSPNATHVILKERSFILKRVSDLQYEIKVWENNIGFFASSKKADILKNEFEEKIEKAKQEINILEEKLRILRET